MELDPGRPDQSVPPAGAAFPEFFRNGYTKLVRTLALAGANGQEEDLAQEAFAIVMTHWEAANSHANPSGYLYKCAFRLLARHARRGVLVLPAWAIGEQRSGDGGFEDTVCTIDQLATVVDSLPPRERACLVAKVAGGMSTAEIASSMGIKASTVRKHLSEANAALRKALSET